MAAEHAVIIHMTVVLRPAVLTSLAHRFHTAWITAAVRTSATISGDSLRPYIRNTPNFISGIGASRLAARASASTVRVCAGSITPSSHNRAVEK